MKFFVFNCIHKYVYLNFIFIASFLFNLGNTNFEFIYFCLIWLMLFDPFSYNKKTKTLKENGYIYIERSYKSNIILSHIFLFLKITSSFLELICKNWKKKQPKVYFIIYFYTTTTTTSTLSSFIINPNGLIIFKHTYIYNYYSAYRQNPKWIDNSDVVYIYIYILFIQIILFYL